MEVDIRLFFNDEEEEWAKLSPQQRYLESNKLWSRYLTLGGSFNPEPDSQSPFDLRAIPANGRAGVYFIRRR